MKRFCIAGFSAVCILSACGNHSDTTRAPDVLHLEKGPLKRAENVKPDRTELKPPTQGTCVTAGLPRLDSAKLPVFKALQDRLRKEQSLLTGRSGPEMTSAEIEKLSTLSARKEALQTIFAISKLQKDAERDILLCTHDHQTQEECQKKSWRKRKKISSHGIAQAIHYLSRLRVSF